MIRRTCVISVFVFVLVVVLAAPALAYGPLLPGYSAFPDSKLAPGADPVVAVWSDGSGSLLAQRYANGLGAQPSQTVVSGIVGLSGWYAVGDGAHVTVVWKAGTTISAKCIDVTDGTVVFGPVPVCTDGAVAALPGNATAATLSGAAPDGSGGAYVWCTVTPTTGVTNVGDSLLSHVQANGTLSVADPGLPVAKGTIAALDVDVDGHAFILVAPPGRTGIAVQRFTPDVAADTGWSKPISPYSPLLPVPAATPTPIDLKAGSGAIIAWREGAKVKVQHYVAKGGIAQLTPAAVPMSGDVKLASDADGGAYLVGPTTGGIVARHILGQTTLVDSGSPSVLALGAAQPHVGALTVNRAGDLFAGYSDEAAAGSSGVGLLKAVGGWTAIGPGTMRPDAYSSAAADGAGGAYLLGDAASSAYLWRLANDSGARSVTFRPRVRLVQYGARIAVAGYVTQADSLPAGGVSVTAAGGGATAPAVTTRADGFYSLKISPKANATWTATSGGATSEGVRLEVAPKVSLGLSHLKASTRLSEIFSGAVRPNHAGSKVLIQKAAGAGWKTVASGKLNSSSRYQIVWYVPYRTALYKLRAMIPAHADHAQGASTTATLKVVIRKG